MARPYILFILFTLSFTITTTFSSSPNPKTITLPLSPVFTKSQDHLHTLKLTASASLTRAHHLKHRHTPPLNTSVSPKGYGGYSIDLSFGTPPQTSSFVLDTGSSLVWLPCSSRYLCSGCNFPNIGKIPTFIPRNSSSAKLLGCGNPKCGYLFGPDAQSRCRGCNPESQNCSNVTCPAYIVQYGLGSTSGFLLLENLDFPGEKTVTDFVVGCSILSIRQPSGIAGFGRGIESLPTQLGLKKFSHCLLSHRFDDEPESSDLVLQIDSTGDTKTPNVSYTPFGKNPTGNNTAFLEYYYVGLKKILVGGVKVKIPLNLLVPESSGVGNGGTIVDSGTTFTFMERPIFDLVAKVFEKQLSNFSRAKEVEAQSGLGLCFDFSGTETVPIPELMFQFKGGARMMLPLSNYFSLVDDSEVACLTIISDESSGTARAGGPAIILGNYQQQNFYVEYDLENDRFGFRQQNCQKSA